MSLFLALPSLVLGEGRIESGRSGRLPLLQITKLVDQAAMIWAGGDEAAFRIGGWFDGIAGAVGMTVDGVLKGGRRKALPLPPSSGWALHRGAVLDHPVSRDAVDVVPVSGPIRGPLAAVQDVDLLAVGGGVDARGLVDAGVGVELCHVFHLLSSSCDQVRLGGTFFS